MTGAFLAVLLLWAVLGTNTNLDGNTVLLTLSNQVATSLLAIIVEATLTMILFLVVSSVSVKKISIYLKGFIIGITLAMLIMTGASLNPAKLIAPAVIEVGQVLEQLCVYVVGSLLGSISSVLVIRFFRREKI